MTWNSPTEVFVALGTSLAPLATHPTVAVLRVSSAPPNSVARALQTIRAAASQ